MILILISKYLSNKIIEHNLWVNKLEQLIMKYDPNLKNALRIIKEIAYYCNILNKLIPEILNICQNAEFLVIYNQLEKSDFWEKEIAKKTWKLRLKAIEYFISYKEKIDY